MRGGVVYPDLCAVLLAGGRSRRMGFEKALITVRGKALVQNLAEVVLPLAGEVVLSANEGDLYQFLKLPIVRDIYPGQGPLAGLHAAMLHSEKNLVFLLACDMPNVKERLVRAIVESSSDSDSVVPRTSDGRIHPLCGVYRRSCLELLGQQLASGRNRVSDFVCSPALRVRYFDVAEGGFPDADFLNLNDGNDLSRFSLTLEPCHPNSGG